MRRRSARPKSAATASSRSVSTITWDPCEALGGEVAKTGKGAYVYVALALYRELPEGVPGAYRLFANLLGLKKANVP